MSRVSASGLRVLRAGRRIPAFGPFHVSANHPTVVSRRHDVEEATNGARRDSLRRDVDAIDSMATIFVAKIDFDLI